MSAPLRIAVLLCGSGMCALVYQVAWLRELRLVFGASTPASAAALAVFMGGLGYGSLRLSRRAERTRRPLDLYASLELLVAVSAAITPALTWAVRWGYVALGGTTRLGTAGGTLVRLVASALVLLPPTFLMGGTLPAAVRAAESDADPGRRVAALLYGANTLGAVLGATLTTFVLIEIFGTHLTLWMGCAVNALVAVAARSVARGLPRAPRTNEASPVLATTTLTTRFVLGASGAVGFVFLLLELVWYRMLAPLLGGSTYTFGLILAVALLGVGGGGLLYARRRDGSPTLVTFAASCALEALFVALPFALGDRLALVALVLRPLGTVGLWGHVLGWTLVTAVVVFPAALVAGYQFPLLIALLGQGRERVAAHVGLAYGWNTAGAIAGSLAGGFVLLPWLSAIGSWKLAVAGLGALGTAALFVHQRSHARCRRELAWPLALVSLSLIAVFGADGPTAVWRHSPIGTGRADHVAGYKTKNELRHWLNEQRYAVTWDTDGRESSIALHRLYDTAFIMNGKTDGSALGDATTQIMGGLLGALVHGHVERALVIGLGTGSTAGWLGAIPEVQTVDVVEIEPAIEVVARELAAVNHDVLDNPKVRFFAGDAREVLLTTPKRYDLVFSEPSNPYRAGIASLFTREFYEAVRARLAPGGVFVQWVQGYDIDGESVRIVYTTLSQVFGSVTSWQADVSDLLLIVRNEDSALDVAALSTRMAGEPYRTALMGVWRVDDVEGLLAHYVAGPALARGVAEAAGETRVNTDDHNLLEFALAKALGKPSGYSVNELHAAAVARGMGRPEIVGDVDWERVVRGRMTITMGRDSKPPPVDQDSLAPADKLRHRAFRAWAASRYDAVLTTWSELGEPPRTVIEHMVVADALAVAGRGAEAAPLLLALARELPTEALAIEARAAFFAGDSPRAHRLSTDALTAYRTDPWPTPELMVRTLDVVLALAKRHPELVEPILVLLSEPFVTDSLRLWRERTRVEIAALHPDPGRCVAALSAFEPHAWWERDFLELRETCYARARHPLAARARAELDRFIADDATPIEGGLLPATTEGRRR